MGDTAVHIQLFREILSGKSEKVHATIPWGNLGYDQWILITRVFKYKKPIMPRPYSNDLRWRAIWMVELLGYSVDEVAATCFMSPRTIERYISKCLNTGDVNSEKLGRPFNSLYLFYLACTRGVRHYGGNPWITGDNSRRDFLQCLGTDRVRKCCVQHLTILKKE